MRLNKAVKPGQKKELLQLFFRPLGAWASAVPFTQGAALRFCFKAFGLINTALNLHSRLSPYRYRMHLTIAFNCFLSLSTAFYCFPLSEQ
ncbi:NADH:ubiquinone oxidoreductase subunit H [Roseimarinus sediminis]